MCNLSREIACRHDDEGTQAAYVRSIPQTLQDWQSIRESFTAPLWGHIDKYPC